MFLGVRQIRERLLELAKQALGQPDVGEELREALDGWIQSFDDGAASLAASRKLREA